MIFSVMLLVIITATAKAQDTLSQYLHVLNYKIQLLDAQIKLMEAKQKLWEINAPQVKLNTAENAGLTGINERKKDDTLTYKAFKSAFKLNPARLFEGTFQLSYERAFRNNFSTDISLMGTYMSSQGWGSGYLKDQSFYAYSNSLDEYIAYNGRVVSGCGVVVQTRNYLLPRTGSKINAPHGLYASPQIMYRKTWITGYTTEWEDTTHTEKIVKQDLDVLAFGVILGGKFTIYKVICIDIFAGGAWRLSKYSNEKKLTRSKKWTNIDYTGVLPSAGITIGIMK